MQRLGSGIVRLRTLCAVAWTKGRIMSTLRYSEKLGRKIRQDSPEKLGESTFDLLKSAVLAGNTEEALEWAEYMRKENEIVHDILTNWVWGLLTFIAKASGEDTVESALRESLGAWFKARYQKIPQLTPEEQLQLTAEGMRGHCTGPGRLGKFDVVDEGERWAIRFDPCGSGGFMRRGDLPIGDQPRNVPPYNFGSTQQPHAWSWNRTGVGFYCAHCALVNEIIPLEVFGKPMRVTEYSADPSGPCVWHIYKNPDDVPARYYERIAQPKPSESERLRKGT